MTAQNPGLIPKIVFLSVTLVFFIGILTILALFVSLGLGVVEMSDIAVSTLGGVTIALINLMRAIVKLAEQFMLHGS